METVEIIAWILFYFSIGIGVATARQLTGTAMWHDDAEEIVCTVGGWPLFLLASGFVYVVRKITKFFDTKE